MITSKTVQPTVHPSIIKLDPNQFHYYQINYNISCVYLTAKEKYFLFFFAFTYTIFVTFLFFFTLTHTNYISRRQQCFALSSLAFFSSSFSFPCSSPRLSSRRKQHFALSSLAISQAKIYFFSLGFTLYILSPHREDPLAKALSIYKNSFSIPSGKEYITSLIRDKLFFLTKE